MITGYQRRSRERGATALIIVMFSVLLFVTITVGFMKIMSIEQTRSNDNELSQGAYDSALAGVEDGKRVLAACGAGDTTACDAISKGACTTVSDANFASAKPNGEVYLKTSSSGGSGADFEQAYTCVKISRSTPNYKGSISADGSAIVPLAAAPGQKIDSIILSWFAPDPNNLTKQPFVDNLPTVPLPSFANWNTATQRRPSLLRAQLMQVNSSGFNSTDFDQTGGSSTLYLYPKTVGSSSLGFAVDGRRTGTLGPNLVKCNADFTTFGGYACQVKLLLPDPVGGSPDNRIAYLRLTSIYNASDFQVQMQSSGQPVNFYDVQPSIDSTGRAADIFRRVDARVERADPNESLLYPRATVDITGNFCKSFVITDNTSDYSAGNCNP